MNTFHQLFVFFVLAMVPQKPRAKQFVQCLFQCCFETSIQCLFRWCSNRICSDVNRCQLVTCMFTHVVSCLRWGNRFIGRYDVICWFSCCCQFKLSLPSSDVPPWFQLKFIFGTAPSCIHVFVNFSRQHYDADLRLYSMGYASPEHGHWCSTFGVR